MPGTKIRSRESIHKRETPQRDECNQDDEKNLERTENSIKESKLDEEYGETANISKGQKLGEESRPKQPKMPTPTKLNNPVTQTIISQKMALLICFFLLPLLGFFVACYRHEGKLSCSFENLQKKYQKETNNVWNELRLGIEMILNKAGEKPAVYLLAHYGKEKSVQLIEEIAITTSKCFGNRIVKIENSDFSPDSDAPDDYGIAIEKYKSKIKEGNVFLIADLNKIPARAARALHAICDTHNPIRTNVVIFLALIVDQNKEGNAHSVAEETLIELWGSELPSHELDPLITRVTDQVIILHT